MSTKQILISKIITDDEIMPRDQINSKYVDGLAEDIKRGDIRAVRLRGISAKHF